MSNSCHGNCKTGRKFSSIIFADFMNRKEINTSLINLSNEKLTTNEVVFFWIIIKVFFRGGGWVMEFICANALYFIVQNSFQVKTLFFSNCTILETLIERMFFNFYM